MNALTAFDSCTIAALDLADPQAVAKVDAWVCAHPEGTPFHRPAWVAAVAKGCRQTALYLVARDGLGEIAGVLPLNRIASPVFGRALVSSGFAVDGGILAKDSVTASKLADECWTFATALGCATAELRGGEIPRAGWTVKTETYLGFSRPIEADTEAQMLAVPKRHRAEIRKGLGHDMVVRHGRGAWFRREHYRCYAELVRNLGTPVFPRALFDAMMDGFGDDAEITLVQHKGRTVSAVLTFYHGATCMPYWGGGTAASRALRSNEVMYLRVMDRARDRGCTIIDLGRSKVGTGVAAWKKTFGFEGIPMAYAVRTADGQPPRDINPLSPQYARKVALWKKLPLPIANLIGPWLARGLAEILMDGEILFLCHRVPFPPDRGDKIRAWRMAKALAGLAPLHIGTFADDDRDMEYASALGQVAQSWNVERRHGVRPRAVIKGLVTGQPLLVAVYDDAAMHGWVRRMLAERPITAVVAFSVQMAHFVPALPATTRFIMDFVDFDSAKYARYGAEGRGPMAWVHRREGKRLLAFEKSVADRADAGLFVSEAEAALFREATGAQNVMAVENGVDLAYFDARADFDALPPRQGPLIVFTGQMDYRPNVEAVTTFAERSLPAIRAVHPTARFAIVGRNPTAAVLALASDSIIVTGSVADVRPWLAAADVVVAPLRIARGVQNKVLEALAMARPVVASPDAVEGIDVRQGAHLIVADAREEARAVLDLLADPVRAKEMALTARARMEARYSWDSAMAPLAGIVSGSSAPAALADVA